MSDFGLDDLVARMPTFNVRDSLPDTLAQRRRAPLIVNAPRAQKALTAKYSGYLRNIQNKYDPQIINALMQMDAQRVTSGQSPLSEEETTKVLNTAQTGTPATPEPERGIGPLDWLGNAVNDVKDIVSSIPRLPMALYHEGMALKDFGKTMGDYANPISGFLHQPGIRMVPGAFTAGAIAEGTPGELLRHPVFTGLDVLPMAHMAAGATPIARLAEEGAEAAHKGLGPALTMKEVVKLERHAARPIATALLNRIEDGKIVRNGLGEVTDHLMSSRIGRALGQNFGGKEADTMYVANAGAARVQNVLESRVKPADALDVVAQKAWKLREELEKMEPPVRKGEVSPLIKRLPKIKEQITLGDYTALTGNDLAAHQLYQETLSELTDWSVANNHHVRFDNEIYDVPTGLKLREHEATLKQRQSVAALRGHVLAADADVTTLATELRDAFARPPKPKRAFASKAGPIDRLESLNRGDVGLKDLSVQYRGTRQALRNSGYDTIALDAARKAKTLPAFLDDLADGRATLPRAPTPMLDTAQIIEYARAHAGGSPTVKNHVQNLVNGMSQGEWKGVNAALDGLRSHPALSDPVFVQSVRNARETAKLLDTGPFRKGAERSVATAQSALDKLARESPSARFIPKLGEQFRTNLSAKLINDQGMINVTDRWSAAKVVEAVNRGRYQEVPGFSEEMYRALEKETVAGWQALRDSGFDPTFVHTVPVNKIGSATRALEGVVPRSASSVRARMFDMAPGSEDITVAISHQAKEFIEHREIEQVVRHITDMNGTPLHELRRIYEPTALRKAGKSDALTFEGHLEDAIARHWRKFDPIEEGYNWGSPYLDKLGSEDMYLPINTYKNLKALADPKSFAGGVFDGTTKAFRWAVTGLSVRTQLYNLTGGVVGLALTEPKALLKFGEAWKMARDHTLVPEALKELVGGGKRTWEEFDAKAQGRVTEGVRNYMVGKKMRSWWDDIQARKTPGKEITRHGKLFKKAIEKVYDLNGVVDDMTRMSSYLDAVDKNLAKGFTQAHAERLAIGTARKVLQDWMGMTPMERNVVKAVIPFYGFMSHAVRFVLRYPLDHPVRAELIAKLATAELEDHNQDLPSRFLGMLFYGGTDENGNRKAFNLGPFNPFGDVGNSMTLAGFMGSTNPVISTAFEALGLDRGTAELYPSLRYDPETGRLAADHGNLLTNFISNVVPQTDALMAMMGMNAEYHDMAARDPAAAKRALMSSLTIPILNRDYNVPQEKFKAELAREKSANSVLNEALKTGDWDEAMKYPSLRAYLAALEQLPDSQRDAFAALPREQVLAMAQSARAGQVQQVPKVATLDDQVAAILNPTPARAPAALPTTYLPPAPGSSIRPGNQGGI